MPFLFLAKAVEAGPYEGSIKVLNTTPLLGCNLASSGEWEEVAVFPKFHLSTYLFYNSHFQ